MSELKRLHKDAIPAALEKAERYRLLNEPGEAESICLDILHVDPENQHAIITLLLALTDRFEKGYGVSDTQTKELLARLKSEYERAYYSGIVAERRAKMKLRQNTPDCRFQAYDLLRQAMNWFGMVVANAAVYSTSDQRRPSLTRHVGLGCGVRSRLCICRSERVGRCSNRNRFLRKNGRNREANVPGYFICPRRCSGVAI